MQKPCSANKTNTDLGDTLLEKDDRRVKLYSYCEEFREFLVIFVLYTTAYIIWLSGNKINSSSDYLHAQNWFQVRSPWVPERSVTIAHNIEGFTEQYQENRQKGL